MHGIRDSRLEGHPYQGIVNSYVGVPLREGDALIGTFCHFDFPALPLPDAEFALMRDAAGLLAQHVR
ncbi:GAF domain-containing protein [Ramlibacter terrae]|uniref:GAF domain-containing protein n=1 Tax=Ramlibacter terrae TaxID=2732511 RepID=A0ABX6P4S5_9BURK|nr:GAF domain-containing protein [Ramlibacter terrae]